MSVLFEWKVKKLSTPKQIFLSKTFSGELEVAYL